MFSTVFSNELPTQLHGMQWFLFMQKCYGVNC